MPKRQLKGTVVSNKSEKTLVVEVEIMKEHLKYKKKYKEHKKYKAHYDEGEFNIEDKVLIEESKPISKDKHWRVIKKI